MVERLKTSCVILVEALLLFAALNLVIAYAVPPDTRRVLLNHPVFDPRNAANLERIYHLPVTEVREIVAESWRENAWVYEPYVQFRERPRSGRFVNISPQGYRLNGPGSPPELKGGPGTIFFFGGSSGFGYGVRDQDTIPAHLEALLRERNPARPATVFNFGRGLYSSTQELLLFRNLVQRGFVPETAVFFHGVNEHFASCPAYSNNIADMFEIAQNEPRAKLRAVLMSLPLMRVLRPAYRSRLDQDNLYEIKSQQSYPFECQAPDERAGKYAISICKMNSALIRGIAAEHGIKVRICVQPIGGYRNGFTRDPYGAPFPDRAFLIRGLEAESTAGAGGVSLAGVLQDFRGEAFVDDVHYTSEASRWIAKAIALSLSEDSAPGPAQQPAGSRPGSRS